MITDKDIIKITNFVIYRKFFWYDKQDDLRQECYLACYENINKFDESKMCKSTFLYNIVQWKAMRFINNNNLIRKPEYKIWEEFQKEGEIKAIEWNSYLVKLDNGGEEEIFGIEDESFLKFENKDYIDYLVKIINKIKLREGERKYLDFVLNNFDREKRLTLQEIGDNLGVSRERARQLKEQVKIKLKKEGIEPKFLKN